MTNCWHSCNDAFAAGALVARRLRGGTDLDFPAAGPGFNARHPRRKIIFRRDERPAPLDAPAARIADQPCRATGANSRRRARTRPIPAGGMEYFAANPATGIPRE